MGNCHWFSFDQDAEFSLVYAGVQGDAEYCPALIEFLAYENWVFGRVASFKKNMDMDNVHNRNRRFTAADNTAWFHPRFNSWHNAIPNSEYVDNNNLQATCPRREQACPVNELQTLRKTPDARKQCFFK